MHIYIIRNVKENVKDNERKIQVPVIWEIFNIELIPGTEACGFN